MRLSFRSPPQRRRQWIHSLEHSLKQRIEHLKMVIVSYIPRKPALTSDSAGESVEAISNSKTSVYTGNLGDDYKFLFAQDIEQNSKYGMVGMTGLLAGRLSWFFNLKGPSLTVDTACSSSLVALDLGCQSLLASSSDMVSTMDAL